MSGNSAPPCPILSYVYQAPSSIFFFNVALRPLRLNGLLGTGSPGRPPQLSHSCWALTFLHLPKPLLALRLEFLWQLPPPPPPPPPTPFLTKHRFSSAAQTLVSLTPNLSFAIPRPARVGDVLGPKKPYGFYRDREWVGWGWGGWGWWVGGGGGGAGLGMKAQGPLLCSCYSRTLITPI